MPENAARKRRARELSQRMGMSYTAALRNLGAGPVPPVPMETKLRRAYAGFGRPVGIIAEPSLPGPTLRGTRGSGERLSQIVLSYGSSTRLPSAYVLTTRPLPGGWPGGDVLVEGLHNLIAAHERHALGRGAGDLEPDADHDVVLRALHAVQAAPRETAEALFADGTRRPCVRVRVSDFEALEMPHEDGSIVYCGPLALTGTVRFGLAEAADA